jgi:hypothetical protein
LSVGLRVGERVGGHVGLRVGFLVGTAVGFRVGGRVGLRVGGFENAVIHHGDCVPTPNFAPENEIAFQVISWPVCLAAASSRTFGAGAYFRLSVGGGVAPAAQALPQACGRGGTPQAHGVAQALPQGVVHPASMRHGFCVVGRLTVASMPVMPIGLTQFWLVGRPWTRMILPWFVLFTILSGLRSSIACLRGMYLTRLAACVRNL